MNAAEIADKYIAPMGHNAPPSAYELVKQEIEDLLVEARNWADGEPIDNQAQADMVTTLLDAIGDAAKRANAARVEENRPFDEGKAEVQARYNLLIGDTKSAKGKAVLAKEALQSVLTPWRQEVERHKQETARRAREEAGRVAAEAAAAMQASRGNLEEREKAEELFQQAQQAERFAKRTDKAATTATGLRTIWHAGLVDVDAALEWAYGVDPARFEDLAQQMANEALRRGVRTIPGFKVWGERVAR